MGDLTRAQIRDEVLAGLANRADFSDATGTTRLNRYIQLAERRLDDEAKWPEMCRTTSAQSRIEVNSTFTGDFYGPIGGRTFGATEFAVSAIAADGLTLTTDAANGSLVTGQVVAIRDSRLPVGIDFARVASLSGGTLILDKVLGTAQGTPLTTPGTMPTNDRGYLVVPIRALLQVEWSDATVAQQDAFDLQLLPANQWRFWTEIPVNINDASGVTTSIPKLASVLEWELDRNINNEGGIRPQVMGIYPAPTSDYVLRARYWKRVRPMVDDDEYSEFEGKDEALISRARHQAFQTLAQREDAAREFTVYNDIVNKAKGQIQTSEPIVPRGVSRRDSSLANARPWTDPFTRRSP